MRALRSALLLAGLTTILLVLAPSVASADDDPPPRLEAGDTIPPNLGQSAKGKPLTTQSFDDVPMVITFWASWCPPCMKELPILESIAKLAGPDKLRVVAINWKEERSLFRRMARQLKDAELTVTHDRKGKLAKDYGVTAIPHLLLVNRDRSIERVYIGYNEDKLPQIVDEINALIASP